MVQLIYNDWCLRARIEHGHRFDQGLDVEDMRVYTLNRMRPLLSIVLLSAQMVFVISGHWPQKRSSGYSNSMVNWVSFVTGWPYWFLRIIAIVITTSMTLFYISCTLSLSGRHLMGNHQKQNLLTQSYIIAKILSTGCATGCATGHVNNLFFPFFVITY
jgi:hypothetical protein